MSKITNDGLTRAGIESFITVRYPYGNSERQRIKPKSSIFSWVFLKDSPYLGEIYGDVRNYRVGN